MQILHFNKYAIILLLFSFTISCQTFVTKSVKPFRLEKPQNKNWSVIYIYRIKPAEDASMNKDGYRLYLDDENIGGFFGPILAYNGYYTIHTKPGEKILLSGKKGEKLFLELFSQKSIFVRLTAKKPEIVTEPTAISEIKQHMHEGSFYLTSDGSYEKREDRITENSGNINTKRRVAVINFQHGKGVTEQEAAYLTERIRAGLVKSKVFEVISNDQINTMIKTVELKQKLGDGNCNSTDCLIDLGNALQCELMLVGNVAGAFGEFAISVKLMSVAQQKYIRAEDVQISKKEKFPDAARKIVAILLEN